MNHPEPERHNLFTLVTYTPEPLRSWLTTLRHTLALEAASQPHVTILPPRPLTLPVNDAKREIIAILKRWRSFDVELSGIQVFPGSNVLYLKVSDGESELRQLHAELNTGGFAHDESFEFHPHVTIGGPVLAEELEAVWQRALVAWETSLCPCRFSIEEVAFVSIAANGSAGDWRRLWKHKLSAPAKRSPMARANAISQTF